MTSTRPLHRLLRFVGTLMGRKPPALQVAALCLRQGETGPEVLLMTSLDTGRWVIPKGWPMNGRSLASAALREAWEEAGVNGAVEHEPCGRYHYFKRKRGGLELWVEVRVFRVTVRRMESGFPEEGQRVLRWTSPKEAAKLVQEPGLAQLLQRL